MGGEGVGSIASHPSGGEGVCEGGGECCAEGVQGGGRSVAVSSARRRRRRQLSVLRKVSHG